MKRILFMLAVVCALPGVSPAQAQHEAEARRKGPDPYIDVQAYGVRAVARTPTTTGSIESGSNILRVANGQNFRNGDGIACRGCGATNPLPTPSAPRVTPSNAAVLTGTGITVANASGSSSYQYQIVARTKGGGYTAASPATSIANGPSTLGFNRISISSVSRTNNTITVSTASSHNLVPGSMVVIQDSAGKDFDGWYIVSKVPTPTTFTYTNNKDTRNGALSSGGAVGTVTWYNCNHVTWASVKNAWSYYIYGRVSGAMVLLGISYPDYPHLSTLPTYNQWDDFGATMNAAILPSDVPDWVPLTPPASAKNDDLVTTIASGEGSERFTLAASASNTVVRATVTFDNAPNITAAVHAAVANRTLYFPQTAAGASYTTASVMTWNLFPNTLQVLQGGTVVLGDTLYVPSGNIQWTGQTFGLAKDKPSFGFLSLPTINTPTATPMLYSSGAVNFNLSHVNLMSSQANNALLFLQDGGSLPANSLDHVQFSTTGRSDYMSRHWVLREVVGDSAAIFLDYVTFIGGPEVGAVGATPLFYADGLGGLESMNHLSLNRRGIFFRGGVGSNTDWVDIQGAVMPVWTIYNPTGTTNVNLDIRNFNHDTSTTPMVSLFGGTQGVVKLTGFTGITPGYPIVTAPNNSTAVLMAGGGAVTNNFGPNLAMVNGPLTGNAVDGTIVTTGTGNYSEVMHNSALAVGSPYQVFINSLPQAAPSCAVGSGGSVAVAKYVFTVAPFFSSGGEGRMSSQSAACATSRGRQTITVTWTPVPGAIGYDLYVNGAAFHSTPPWVKGGTSTEYVWASESPSGASASTIPASGPSYIAASGMGANQFKFASSNNQGIVTVVAPALSGTNRTQNLPDASGTFLLDATANSNPSVLGEFFDNFNRSNGGVGSDYDHTQNTIVVSGHQVTGGTAGAWNSTRLNPSGIAYQNDQYSAITVSAIGAGDARVSVGVRMQSQALSGYICGENTKDNTMFLESMANGAPTSLAHVPIKAAVGDYLLLSITGTRLTCTRHAGGVLTNTLSASPGTYSTGSPGIAVFSNTSFGENYNAGNLFPLAHTSQEQDWTAVQHHPAGITVGSDSETVLTSAVGNSGVIAQAVGGITPALPVCTDANKNLSTGASDCTAGIRSTLTHKTIDAEGTGNAITMPFKIFVRFATCNNGTASLSTDTTAASQVGCFGRNTKLGVWQAADADALTFSIPLAADWTGNIDGRLFFNSPDTSGTAIFHIALACVDGSGAAADDPAYNAPSPFSTVRLAAPANASWVTSVSNITKSGTTTCAAGNWLNGKVTRATDTAKSRVNAKGLELTLRRTMQ